MNSLGRRFAWGTGGKRKLCIVPCWSCNIYKIRGEVKWVGKVLKLSYMGVQTTKRAGPFFSES